MAKQIKGILGEKLGMTQVWDENNRVVPVTVVKASPNVVTQVRDADTDGYAAVQLGYGAIDPRKVTKPLTGHFDNAGVTPRRFVVEVRTADAADYTVGQELVSSIFDWMSSRSTLRFSSTAAATPSPSRLRPRRMCSGPTYSW